MKRFPVLLSYEDKRKFPSCPQYIKWVLLSDRQAIQNHGQNLVKLAGRGGLDPIELLAVMTNKSQFELSKEISERDAVNRLIKITEDDINGRK